MSMNLVLLLSLLVTTWVAGGASRADTLGQVVMRSFSWGVIIVSLLFGPRPSFREARPILFILLASLLLVLMQLVPLPPSVWTMLPGRHVFAGMPSLLGPTGWRPLAIVPGAAANSAESLVVPFATWLLAAGLKESEHKWLPVVMLAMVAMAAILGLLQFSGVGFDNPLINDTPGEVSGNFANRNHFALFLAFGCVLAPAWAFARDRRAGWRMPVAGGLVLLFVLLILASGSRAGLLVGALGTLAAFPILYNGIRREYRRLPAWVFPAVFIGILALLGIFVLISMNASRAVSINRLLSLDSSQDLRTLNIFTVTSMVKMYFPFGSGYGGFATIFAMHEPFGMLKWTYFNHAHNDFLEIALDGGILAIMLCASSIAWWAMSSIKAWWSGPDLAKVGSTILGLILIASIFDYPARTPTMMTFLVVAAIWLVLNRHNAVRTPLPAATR